MARSACCKTLSRSTRTSSDFREPTQASESRAIWPCNSKRLSYALFSSAASPMCLAWARRSSAARRRSAKRSSTARSCSHRTAKVMPKAEHRISASRASSGKSQGARMGSSRHQRGYAPEQPASGCSRWLPSLAPRRRLLPGHETGTAPVPAAAGAACSSSCSKRSEARAAGLPIPHAESARLLSSFDNSRGNPWSTTPCRRMTALQSSLLSAWLSPCVRAGKTSAKACFLGAPEANST
mmetsp:Transcript_4876/g.14897  ORF Transcript_4876/g.14897 Transcript_4876/m.14897 type:complete len:239 (-) Transcript_4876:83-799(-)